MKPGKTGLRRLIDATGYSMKGIQAVWRHEAAFRQEVAAIVVLLPASFFVAQNSVQWLLLVAPLLLVLIVELLNSAIESVVDRIGHEPHDLSGQAKDMGSAAVFFCLLLIALSWGSIAWQNFGAGFSDHNGRAETVMSPTSADDAAQPPCKVDPPAEAVACTMEWRPVCGCDGKTYSNACMARAAGVSRHREGECAPAGLD